VGRDPLFEQPGERQTAPTLPPRSTPPGEPQDPGDLPNAGESLARSDSLARLADLAGIRAALGPGGGPRLINHWATWCAPCVDELPHLVSLHRDHGERVAFLGLGWELFMPGSDAPERVAEVSAFCRQHGLSWPTLLVTTPPDDFFAEMRMDHRQVPQTWLLDDAGTIRRRIDGPIDEDGARQVSAWLAEL